MKINKFKVKELMAKKKISSQTELAEVLGISKNQVSNILSEKFNPIKSNVMELAKLLEVSQLEIMMSFYLLLMKYMIHINIYKI